MVIETSPRFDKSYRKLAKQLKDTAKEKERVFRADPYHPSLRMHKLHDKDKDLWAFWITQKYRIKFIFISDTHILFLNIGTHDFYE